MPLVEMPVVPLSCDLEQVISGLWDCFLPLKGINFTRLMNIMQ